MVSEKEAPSAEVAKEVIKETPEATQAKAPSIEELTGKVTQLGADLEAARKEAKSHQEYGRKQHEELEKQKRLDTEVSTLKSQLQVQTEMIAAIMDKEGEVEETPEVPKKRRSEEYLARIKQPPIVNPQQEAFMKVAEEADGLVKSAGLDMEKSPELKEAYRLFRVGMTSGYYIGDAQDGLEEIKKVVEKITQTPKTEAKKELSESEEEEIARKYMEKKGLLKSDTSLPSGTGGKLTSETIAKMSPQERFERRDEIAKMSF